MMINIMNIRDMHCVVKLYAVVASLRVDESINFKSSFHSVGLPDSTEHTRLPLQITKLGRASLQNKGPSLPPV